MKILKSTDGNLVEMDVEVIAETTKALLIKYADIEVWIPNSQLEDGPNTSAIEGLFTIVIPEWLAIIKDLV